MNIQFDTLSYKSRYREIPAIYKIIFTFLLGVVAYISHTYVQMFVILGAAVFLLSFVKIPIQFLLKWIFVPGVFLIISLPAIVFGVSRIAEVNDDIWFSLIKFEDWRLYISKSGWEQAYSIIFRTLSLFICVLTLIVTTPFNEILHALKKLGVPQVLLDVLVSMYRFIFIFLQYVEDLNLVVKSRQGNVTWKRTLHSAGLVGFQLFFKTFEKYKRMSMVIESRGFIDQLFYADDRKTTVSWKFISWGLTIITFLIGMEWWCRNS